MVSRIIAHVSQGNSDLPLTEQECTEAVRIIYEALQLPAPSDLSPANGQPYRLHLLRQLAESWGDPDLALLPFLQEGVPTGALSPMPCSRQWPAKPPNTSALPELELCEGNWKTAEEEPEVVQSLLDKEISNNWVVATDLTEAQAQRKWPWGVAIGKLNVVFAENKEPRLVLDSTVCQVNTRCYLPERLSLPMASDLALATQASDTPGAFLGAKAAHKQIQVRPDEHGLLLFAFQSKLYHYRLPFWRAFCCLLVATEDLVAAALVRVIDGVEPPRRGRDLWALAFWRLVGLLSTCLFHSFPGGRIARAVSAR